jgi:hypothetical protein
MGHRSWLKGLPLANSEQLEYQKQQREVSGL